MRGNRVSLVVVLAALAIFAVMQWAARNGMIATADPTATVVAVGSEASAPPTVEQPAADDESDDAEAEASVTVANTPPADEDGGTTQPNDTQMPAATDQPTPTANAPPTTTPPPTPTPTAVPTAAPTRASNLPTIAYAELPPEAHDTIALIEAGGPFPFSRDGLTFQNRERLLPRHPEGYYQEYTVITPGSRDRGARRIVTGAGGEMYYTDDHYASFREIVR